jgi:single stranded DNA-binding protein
MAGETMLTIIGNLARDPELRTLGNGSTVANLTIASSTRQFNRQSNQWEDGDTLFMNCSAWDSQRQKLASNIVATLAKGMRVIASGRLQQRSYQAQDGSQRTVTEMRLEEIGPALTRATAQVTRVQAGGGYAGGSTYGDPQPRTRAERLAEQTAAVSRTGAIAGSRVACGAGRVARRPVGPNDARNAGLGLRRFHRFPVKRFRP